MGRRRADVKEGNKNQERQPVNFSLIVCCFSAIKMLNGPVSLALGIS